MCVIVFGLYQPLWDHAVPLHYHGGMPVEAIVSLCDRAVHEHFAAYPGSARDAGDHSADGQVPPIGEAWLARRRDELRRLAADLDRADSDSLTPAAAADLRTAVLRTRRELFQIDELRLPQRDPSWGLECGANVSRYVSRDYAPVADRADALCRHLEQIPEFLKGCLSLLDKEVLDGPREIAIDTAKGQAAFYRDELRITLGALPPDLQKRLDSAVEAGAAACDAYVADVSARQVLTDSALGEKAFLSYLEAEEGVVETKDTLLARIDVEIERLRAQVVEVAAQVLPGGSIRAAFAAVEADHSTADSLVSDTAAMLSRLREFWVADGSVGIPEGDCQVRPTPLFYRWASAMYETSGPLEPKMLPHYYYITPVQDDWSAQQSLEWLEHLNRPMLENIAVHEVFPGHFVHDLHAAHQPSLIRRVNWHPAHGEGWAHYTEELAVERGLTDGRPAVHLVQIQDALLRACRFRSAIALHIEGRDVRWATDLFVREAHLAEFPALREAQRGTHDPMYLAYTYGKLAMRDWRDELSKKPGFSLRAFHDSIIDAGQAPLGVIRDLVLGA